MSNWPVNKRIQSTSDLLLWGLEDLRNRLIHQAWWPSIAVPAVDSDGVRWTIQGLKIRQHTGKSSPKAAILPAVQCIWGQVQLPAMPRNQLPAAVREAMWQRSPIAPDQMLCGWLAEPTPGGGWQVDWGLAPLSKVVDLRQQAGITSAAPTFLRNSAHIYPVRDQAYSRLQRRQSWLDTLGLIAIFSVTTALAGLAFMPSLLQRQAVVEAMVRVQALEPQAAPIRQNLDTLRNSAQVLEEVRTGIGTAIPVAHLLDILASSLPDDTVLERLDVNGAEIRIAGLTANATDLLSHLSKNPNFSSTKASNAAVRENSTNKERFTFELRLKGEAKP
jgi:general secretion pathway protein L